MSEDVQDLPHPHLQSSRLRLICRYQDLQKKRAPVKLGRGPDQHGNGSGKKMPADSVWISVDFVIKPWFTLEGVKSNQIVVLV